MAEKLAIIGLAIVVWMLAVFAIRSSRAPSESAPEPRPGCTCQAETT